MTARDQLSLFASGSAGEQLNALRRVLDPVQAARVPAHVTLCREDEIGGLADVAPHLAGVMSLTLRFGPPQQFQEHGILLPCVGGQAEFDTLRRRVLQRNDLRFHGAHLTLAHPRNPRAPGNRLPIDALAGGMTLTFTELRWIRQPGATHPWQTLARWDLGSSR